jgi:hypothetical protein
MHTEIIKIGNHLEDLDVDGMFIIIVINKMYIKELLCSDFNWINLAQNRDQ